MPRVQGAAGRGSDQEQNHGTAYTALNTALALLMLVLGHTTKPLSYTSRIKNSLSEQQYEPSLRVNCEDCTYAH